MFCSGIWSHLRYSMTLQFWEPPTFIYCKRLFFRYTQRGWPYDSVCKQCMFTPPSDNTGAAWVIPANNVTVLSSDDILASFWRNKYHIVHFLVRFDYDISIKSLAERLNPPALLALVQGNHRRPSSCTKWSNMCHHRLGTIGKYSSD